MGDYTIYEVAVFALIGFCAAMSVTLWERFTKNTDIHARRVLFITATLGPLAIFLAAFLIDGELPDFSNPKYVQGIFAIVILCATVCNFFAILFYIILRKILLKNVAEQVEASDSAPSS